VIEQLKNSTTGGESKEEGTIPYKEFLNMRFQPFVQERMMSKFENKVDYNLSESGVHPLTVDEFLDYKPGIIDKIRSTFLNYPYANGNPGLRENIAQMNNGASADNVLVTVGAIEANYNSIHSLLSPGDEIAIMLPNYLQIWGVAKNRGLKINEFHLSEKNGWALDIAELEAAVTPKTKLIAVCNPNNPTGKILTQEEMDAVVNCASKVGSWILSDEVYRGATRVTNDENPSFYGLYDKVLAIGSTSKAYGLPGLRLGWVVGPIDTVDEILARHEYNTLSTSMLSNVLAEIALSPDVRPKLLMRTRGYMRRGFPILEKWMNEHPNTFEMRPPDAAAIAFLRYKMDINSTEFVEKLMHEKSVLIVAGDHFGLDHFIRVSYGLPEDYLIPALDRIDDLMNEL
jgi:aspartate/methionine/tyrosine aminotransferase